jgi:three-Cys-motif partner protein
MADHKANVFPRKKVATRVKHRILENCLKAWGGIIITSNRGRAVHLAFVDTCCGSGLYAPDDIDTEADYDVGSALIGIDVLTDLLDYGRSVGRDVTARALFINESADELETLSAAIADRGLTSVPHEMVASRLTDVVAQVGLFCQGRFGFLFIDPYGPSATPFSVVAQLVQLNYSDCLINFPYYSVHKWVGWLDSPEREPFLLAVDGLLNGNSWRAIAGRHRRDGTLEGRILDHYMDQLAGLGVAAFALPMTFEDRNRTMYHLVFTSRKTAGLAAAKKELQNAEAYQAALKAELKAARHNQGLLDFMTSDAMPGDPVDMENLAEEIQARYRGRSATVEEVIRFGLFRPHVLESHVRKAITILKRQQLLLPAGDHYHDALSFRS